MSFKIMNLFLIERIGQERYLLNGQWRMCKWWAICMIWWEVHPWAQKRESDPCPILNQYQAPTNLTGTSVSCPA